MSRSNSYLLGFITLFIIFFGALGFLDLQKDKNLEFGFYAESSNAMIVGKENVFYCGRGLPNEDFLSRGKVKLLGFFSPELEISPQNINNESKIACLPSELAQDEIAPDWWILTENFLPENATAPKKGILYLNGRAATKQIKAYAVDQNIPLLDFKTFAYFLMRNGELSSLEKPN